MIAFIFLSKILGSSEPLLHEVIQIAVLFLELLSLAAIFKALIAEDERFLLPFMIFQVLGLIVSSFFLVIVTIALIDTDSFAATMIRDQVVISKESAKEELNAIDPAEDEEFLVRITAVFAIATIAFAIAITVWWMWVVGRCYFYFRDLNVERAKRSISLSFKAATMVP
uniref:Transmembrane protein n=1 Tax=Ascaris lumbricoides TaxID=6252 RepID=A0A0M3I395_ASCLU